MSKPLVFVRTKIKVEGTEGELDSWELIALLPSPLMHAAWNPIKGMLVCQFDSVKEGFENTPKQDQKTKKVTFSLGRIDTYYRVTISDAEAIQYILENYVGNYTGQDWNMLVGQDVVGQESLEPSEDVHSELTAV